MTPSFRAILFDFDGVLARTMEDNFFAWVAALSDFGATLQPEEYYPFEGMALRELAKKYCIEKSIDLSAGEEILLKKEKYYLEHHNFALYPSVFEYIDKLAARAVPIAIVTTGLYDRIARSAPKSFLEKFDAIVTGDATKRGKPFPDPYLAGADKINIPIAECIVVENSPAGITSAKSAGAYCIAICSTLDKKYLQGADEVIGAFRDLARTAAGKWLL